MEKNPTILVTGGAGYIGSHTCKILAGTGCTPVVYDNFDLGHRWAVKYGPLVEGDLADVKRLRDALAKYRVGAVVHFAGSTYVGESMENPRKYFQNNSVNTHSLLEAMQDMGVETLVYSSTCATYGIPKMIPISEEHPQSPISPYGDSKYAVERAIHWFGEAYGLRWVALRYFNAAGADPDAEIGEFHVPETHLIPIAIEAVLKKRPHVDIFGTDYPTEDGTAVRDYVHVCDLAEAHRLALNYLQRGGDSSAFNLGTGKGHSVREVIRAVGRASGREVPSQEKGRRPGDPAELIADARRAAGSLGWRPRLSGLDKIAETAWNWHSKVNVP